MLVRLETARRILDRARFRRPRVVRRPLEAAVGSLVAEEVLARRDQPVGPVAAMDGFAVKAYDDRRNRPYTLRRGPHDPPKSSRPLRDGEAVTIATGSLLPVGANAVVRLESARAEGGLLTVRRPVRPGQDIMPQGEAVRRGQTILLPGELVRPYHLGALLADGRSALSVYDLHVSVLPVGDELRGPDRKGRGTVTDTIGPLVRAVFDFAATRVLPAVGDESSDLRRSLLGALRSSELVVTIGGASVGSSDVTKGTLAEMGELLFEGVSVNVLKRGAVARVGGRAVLVLPGQVVSAVTCAHEHGLHLVSRLVGRELRCFETARLSESVEVNHRMDGTYLFRVHDGVADPLPWGVARTAALLQANAFAVLDRHRRWARGTTVLLQRLRHTAG